MQALLEKIKDLDIRIQVEGNDLRLSIPENVDCDSIIEEIRTHKNDLISFIQKKRNRVKRDYNGTTASNQDGEIKLTPTQRRVFILQQLDKKSIAYNIPLAIEIRGACDKDLLEKSITKLIQRHEILRTRFKLNADNNPVQVVQEEFDFEIECLETSDDELNTTIEQFVRPFDLEQTPLIRTCLIKLDEKRFVLVIDMHHLVVDGTSQKVFIQELFDLYSQKTLQPKPLQFKDYVGWYFSPNNQNHISNQRSFWLRQLSGYNNELQLPTDFPGDKKLSFEGKSISLTLGIRRLKKLNELARQSDTSLFMVLLSLYGILISKLTNEDDLVVGTPVANRTNWEFQRTIGMIVNTLPVRLQPRTTLYFRDYLKIVSQGTLACFDNQEYVYEELIKDLNLNRSSDPNPLFNVLLSHNKLEGSTIKLNDLELIPFEVNKPTAKFDLSLHFTEKEEQLYCVFEYRTKLFTAKTIRRYFRYFKNIVDQVLADETVLLKDISLLNEKQAKVLLNQNDFTQVSYPEQATVVELFEKQADTHPDNTALLIDDQPFTYKELNERANQIAHRLRREGIGPDKIVGIFLDKSFEMIAAMMGILKAGGAYLPIDLAYPESRISYLIDHSKTTLLITNKEAAHRLEAYSSLLLLADNIIDEPVSNLPHINKPNDLCYIIYTSGTTGNPKGVMVEHRNLVRLLFNDDFQFEFGSQDIWTMFHGGSFDFSVWEMYGALLYGGTLIIIPQEVARNAFAFRNIVEKYQVTVLNQTPTAFYNFIKASGRNGNSKFPHLRYVIFGGEELVPGKLEYWHGRNPHTQLINMYGITETTVHVTFKRLSTKDINKNISNIGKPIPTNLIYLLDDNKNVVPVGSLGEIYVGGAGVTRGYLNNPDLTASRFIDNPFIENQRLYKSGDVARQLGNGEYEYLGRNDRQVQIKGFRIELGEIEYQLEQNELVQQAVVVANKDERYPWICAYIVTVGSMNEEELREFLSHRVPYYMVPNYFINIDSVPYTSNFKVDYKKLPEPSQGESSNYVAPVTKPQKVMSEIFLKHLGASKIGIQDNFFALGGDSIRALSVISEINDVLNISLEIADIYAYPTIEELCKQLDQKSPEDWNKLKRLAEQELEAFQEHYKDNFPWEDGYEEVFPMNGVEKGMVFHSLESSQENKSVHDVIYHEQNIYLFAGTDFDFERFKSCLKLLVKKHSALRKIYDLENLAHIVLKEIDPDINYVDLTDSTPKEQEAYIKKFMDEEKLKETKLDFSLFWRMTMFKVSEVHHYLLYDFHHSLFDGWSLSTFLTELRNLYILTGEDKDLKPQPLQSSFRDQILTEIAAGLNEGSIQYWKKELDGFERLKFHPTGLPHQFRTHRYDLGKDFRKVMEKVAYKNNSNLKHLCFLAYLYLMKMFTGKDDLTVGLVTNNRPTTKDGEKLLGCFLNTIPFRAKFEGDQTWQELVKYVDSKMIELKRHDRIPMQKIAELADDNSISINPIFKTSYSYLDFHVFEDFIETSASVEEETGFQFKDYMNNNTLFDIVVTAHKGSFTFVLLSSTSVIDDATSARLFEYFKNILHKIADHLNSEALQNDLLLTSEKEYLLGSELNPAKIIKPITSIAEKFEEQVKKTPSEVAVVCGSRQLTYSELYQQSKRVAQYLRKEKAIKPGDFVGIKLERSEWQLIALWGVLQARACYVPIDPAYPKNRVKYIEEDSQCKETIDADWIESFQKVEQTYDDGEKSPDYQMSDKVYMIYTSGSTGKPKGVPINNSNIGSYVEWAMEYYKGDLEQFTFPYVTSLSFDISQPTILLPLLTGGKIHIYEGDDLGETMNDVMANKSLNSIFVTPSYLKFIDEGSTTSITNLIIGGEPMLPSHLEKLRTLSPNARIFNAYGPTECTVVCVCEEISDKEDNEPILIGTPSTNSKIYILDDQNQLVPNGFVGELCVSGEGVSHGYWNRPELSKQKFINDPYSKDGERRMYKTGDLARWTENGALEVLGRKDDQVKIRGYRIELDEIISCIDKQETVAQNIVLVKKDHRDNNFLVGFIVPATENFNLDQLKEYLRSELPHYMVPGVLLELPELPLNKNGKIDKQRLLKKSINSKEEKVGARNEIEAQLLDIWKEVLQIDAISIYDNFFELGGHSVSAITLTNKIQRVFNVKVPLHELFNNSSLASLAHFIAKSAKEDRIVINPAPDQEFYPLSSVQKRQYFIYQLNPDALSYNIPAVLRITGGLDVTKLEQATNQLIERHTILRTCYTLQDGKPVQWIKNSVHLDLHVTTCLESEIDDQVKAFIRPFDLENELPIRYAVLQVSEEDHLLLIDMHHIILDQASRDIIFREMMQLYQGADLPQLRLQYKDYVVWQEGEYYANMISQHKDFWLNVYDEVPPLLEIPADYPRPNVLSGSGHTSAIQLGKPLSDHIRTIVRKEGTSVFNFMLAAYNIFLSKLSYQNDITVGVTSSGRQHEDLEDVVGMFANTLALRNRLEEGLTFREFLSALHNNTVNAFDHRFYPYDDLVDSLKVPRITNRNPLFDVYMIYSQKVDESLFQFPDFTIEPYELPFNAAKFDLTFKVIDAKEEIELSVEGHQSLFKPSSIERFTKYLKQIVKEAAANPNQRIEEIDLLSKAEKRQLLSFNQPNEVLEQSLIEQFSERVEMTPFSQALIFRNKTLTYLELDQQSKRLANYLLQEKDIQPGDFVGIKLNRSEWSVIAMLGAMYARAAYVPIDPTYPESRIEYIESDSQCREMIDEAWIKSFLEKQEDYEPELEDQDYQMSDNIYMIYTSGSTGNPKGVAINNENLDNYVAWAMEFYKGDLEFFSFPLFSPLSFDLTQTSILLTILSGGELHIYNGEDVMTTMKNILSNASINSLKLTPSHIHIIEEDIPSEITNFILGGEALLPGHIEKIRSSAPDARVFNEYGPTEATIGCTCAEIREYEESKFISIGKPIANTNVYILNNHNQLVPPGVVGELCVSGPGVANGYFNRPELTGQKFGKDPYSKEKGRRMYKTGDLARWTEDGELELFGRKDDQVKVRGFRVELGEITATIDTYEQIKQNIVLVKKDTPGNNTLVAYIVPKSATFDIEHFKKYLENTLPAYMIPDVLLPLEKLPLTQNGKIDKEHLLKTAITSSRVFEKPRNELEAMLVEIWQEVLAVDTIGINDNFFELGGNSLKAILMTNKVSKALSVATTLRSVFDYQDVKSLAIHIDGLEKVAFEAIPKAPSSDFYPLSSAQQRMYFLYELDKNGTSYNMPAIYRIGGRLDINKLEQVFEAMVCRHHSLRTIFEIREGQPVQYLVDADAFSIDFREVPEAEIPSHILRFIRPFDLSKDLPIRVSLLKTGGADHILMIDMHHIAGDGVSMEVMMRDFWSLYQGTELPDLEIQYIDYAVWQQSETYKELVAKHKQYWLDVFAEEVAALELPGDHPRPPVLSNKGYQHTLSLKQEQSEYLRSLALKNGITMYTLLLGIYKVFLHKMTNEEDIVVGTPTAGRHHADTEGIVGMFVNTLALRNTINPEWSFEELLAQIQDRTLSAFDHQLYQYEDLVEALEVPRNINRNPLFDVFYSYEQEVRGLENMESELQIAPYQSGFIISKFDLSLNIYEDEVVNITLTGRKDLFEQATLERFTVYLERLIAQIQANPALQIGAIDLLSKEEKQQLLAFNPESEIVDKSIVELFAQQVQNTPDKQALVFRETSLTYRELDEQSNQLARYLLSKEIGKGDMVGLFLDRSIETITGILAILKAGAAYVPIDPGFPDERVAFLLEDASIHLMLSSSQYQESLQEKGCHVIALDTEREHITSQSTEALTVAVKPDDLMYVIYTSGSTGRPKGVMLEHRSLANLSAAQIDRFEVTPEDRILQFTTLTFDVSVSEMLMALLSGAALILVGKDIIHGGDSLVEYMKRQQVSIASMPPAYLKVLDKSKLGFLRCIITAGEAANVEDAQYLCDKTIYYNAYGPTECAVYSTTYEVDPQKQYTSQIPIGMALNNLKAYVLDSNDQLCPIGVVGELGIAGVGVARGYLNRPELTKEKFVTNPFNASERMYRTGDYVRWSQEGQLEFLGRRDHQVKIRGFRIELGEIEATLDKCSLVKQATVQVIEKENDKNIVAYIVPDGSYDPKAILSFIGSKLPKYMKPAYLVEMENIPLTSHGKIDRRSLPNPDAIEREYTAPSTPTEEQLVTIWSETLLLDAATIGINDGFFELGGNSLKAILMINNIRKAFSVDVTLRSVFQYQDIKSLANHIDGLEKVAFIAIPKAPATDFYPLSSAQQRMYFLYELDKKGTSYNMPAIYKIGGSLDVGQLESVFNGLVTRHQSLRSLYELRNGQPVQRLAQADSFSIDYQQASDTDIESRILEFIRPFDLSRELPIRVSLLETSEPAYVLMIDMHHIAGDGVSMEVMMRDFWSLYQGTELPDLEIQYIDYAVWQQSETYKELVAKHKQYWLDKFSEEVSALELPTDHLRPSVLSNEGHQHMFSLDEKQSKDLRALAQQEGVTMYTLLLGIYKVFLHKMTNEEDIVVGTPTAGRHHADTEGIVGMFVNTLALRNTINPEWSFEELLAQIQDRTLSAFDHQLYQYEDLVEALEVPRNINRNPLFDVFYSYEQEVRGLENMESELQIAPYQSGFIISKFDLSLNIYEDEVVNITLTGRKDLFEQATLERFTVYLERLIAQIQANPALQIGAIDLLSKEEKQQLLAFNPESEIVDKSIVELFAQQVQNTPDKQALVFRETSLTYRELDEQSNQLARYLLSKEIGKGDMVGLFLDRSIETITGILAILKAGAAYVPIDPGFPDERVAFLLEDASIHLMLSSSQYQESLQEKGCHVIALDTEREHITSQSTEALTVAVKPDDLMYVIYTSGSTGRPKGVMLEHRSLANLSAAQIDRFEVTPEDRILQFTTLTFDVSVSEILMALLSGAALILVEKDIIHGGDSLVEYMKRQQVSIASMPPAYLKVLDKSKLGFLRCIITAGEAANVEDAQYLCDKTIYYNAYGPTECAVYSTTYEVDPQKQYTSQIPIGMALNNLKAYVLDSNDQLCPIGVVGELGIAGVGVARGYLNRPELTKEKFVTNPFNASERMYRTGDYVRWSQEGQLEFLGRRDHQVKIRGFRIELGEIEATLDKCSLVKQATVQVIEKENDKNIVAYVVPNGEFDPNAIQLFVGSKLPDYMRPAYIIELDNIPLTSHGKIDRRSLPNPDAIEREYIAPSTPTEEQLVTIWSETLLLDAATIGINDGFFELGGNSLKAILMINNIRKAFSVDVTLRSVFQYQDIKSLANHIDGLEKVAFIAIPKAPASDFYPLSSAQQRMYFLYELDKKGTSYNMPAIYKIGGSLDVGQLESVFNGLVTRHQSLRSLYELRNGQPVQRLAQADSFSIDYQQASDTDIESRILEFIRPFDLSRELPIRVSLLETSEPAYVLMIDMHHIAGDGISMELLMRDFWLLYQGNNLKDLDIQYIDYAVWQQSKTYQELVAKHKQYWLDKFSEEVSALELPTDHLRPSVLSNEGHQHMFSLDERQSEDLRALAQQEGVTMYTLLLGIYKVFLNKMTNEEDLVVGTPTAGRHHADTEGIVGMFVNTLALRNTVKPDASFKELLEQLQDHTLSAFEHQLYQYEDLVEALEVPRKVNRNPLFDVFYSYHQQAEELNIDQSELDITPYEYGRIVSKFDLNLDIYENDSIHITIRGRRDLFEQATLERFTDYLNRIIIQVLANPDQQLKNIGVLSKEEEKQILKDYNDTSVTYDLEKTVLDRFVRQAAKTPKVEALKFNGQTLTYEELDARSTQWASGLIQRGVSRGDIVGLLMSRSTEMITAILAVMKAGAAYLPINTEQPVARTLYMLEESDSSLIISNVDTPQELNSSFDCLTPVVLDQTEEVESALILPTCEDLAYIIYTSGSTGNPKGVMVGHESLTNLIHHLQAYYGINDSEKILQFSPYYFDPSVEQIWLALNTGSTLILIEKNDLSDPNALNNFLRKNEITYLHSTPSFLDKVNLENLPDLKRVIAGGEVCSPLLARKISSEYKFYNKYGPSEATVTSSVHLIKPDENPFDNVPIGKPISNAQIFLLNKVNQVVPPGVIGELFIGGKGLAKGYLNRPDLTAQRFIENPFGEGLLYKTGDLARWLPDGNIEFIGRADQQVKLNGVRIELGEIESHLSTLEGITNCAVDLREIKGIKSLVAYYASKSKIAESTIRLYLLDNLPSNMVPSYYIQMEALPTTNSGKLDRRSLPTPDNSEKEYLAPSSPTEKQLVFIWSEILSLEADEISVDANFFGLGGHSLALIRMMHLIREALNTEIPIDYIYRYSTVRKIAKEIEERKALGITTGNRPILLREQEKETGNVFFIHDGSGNINGYMSIVQSINKYNCYGLAFENLNLPVENLDLKILVSLYLERIKKIQKNGPYVLVGWSAGGVLSYEIARQLEEEGEQVAQVILIDTHFNFDEHTQPQKISLASEMELINSWTASETDLNTADIQNVVDLWDAFFENPAFESLTLEELRASVPPQIQQMIGFSDQMTPREILEACNKVRYVTSIVNSYQLASPISARVTYLKASETDLATDDLSEYLTDFNAIEIPGNHFSIMKNGSVELIVQTIES